MWTLCQSVKGVVVSLLLGLCVTAVSQAEVPSRCLPAFPEQMGLRNGWVGADAAYSVQLSQERDLWIFGDTLLGPKRALQNSEPLMTRNSLGISRCEGGRQWTMQYLIPEDAHGNARSVFIPNDPSHWYWPMDGFIYKRKLWIVLLCLRQPRPPRPGGFNFESCGVDLASLPVSDAISATRAMMKPLTPPSVDASMSSTAVRHGRFAYFFGIREGSDRALLLSRVRLSRLSSAAQSLEFLAEDGHWHHNLRPQQAKVLLQPGASEMSVRYHPEWHSWLMVYKDPDLTSDQVLLRSAPALSGPWSPARSLFAIRTLDPAASRPGNFCYAAKEHPEFAERGELVLTYVCNANDPAALLTQDDVYIPQVVRIAIGPKLQVLQAKRISNATPDRSAPLPVQMEAVPGRSQRP